MPAIQHKGISFVNQPKPTVKVTEVDPEMKAELEGAWKHLRQHPEQEVRLEFENSGDAKRYLAHAKAWAGSRTVPEGEQPVEVRKMNRKENENVLVFTIRHTDPAAKKPGRPASHASRASDQAKSDQAKK